AVAVGDFNGDGIPDLAVANYGDLPNHFGSVSILLGNGDGTFQPASDYPAGQALSAVVVADFNGDGILDLAVAHFTRQGTVSMLLGDGAGSFQPPIRYVTGNQANSVATADFNGDGIADLVVANEGERTVSVLLGIGDGTFQAAVNYAAGSGAASVAVG